MSRWLRFKYGLMLRRSPIRFANVLHNSSIWHLNERSWSNVTPKSSLRLYWFCLTSPCYWCRKLASTCNSSIVIEMTHSKQYSSARFWTGNEVLSGINYSLQEVPLNRNCHVGLTLYTAIQFYPHWYPVLPLYRFKTNVARCDWWVKVVINHGILINVSSKNLWSNNIRGFPLNLW